MSLHFIYQSQSEPKYHRNVEMIQEYATTYSESVCVAPTSIHA